MAVYRDNSELIENVIKTKESSLNELQKKFIKYFYDHIPYEDLLDHDPEHYLHLALNAYNFFQKKDQTSRIRCYNPTIIDNGFTSINTVLEVHHDDIPFLVDSVSGALIREGYRISQLIHPVINVKRKTNGEIEELYHESDTTKSSTAESFMQIHFYGVIEENNHSEIINYISNILSNVSLAVSDWHNMLEKAETLKQQFDNNSESVEFINWIKHHSFTFLAYLETENGKIENKLGIAKNEDKTLLEEIIQQNEIVLNLGHEVVITKIHHISPVHKNINLNLISIIPNGSKKVFNFIGLFTSAVYYQSATLIPIVRQKIDAVLKKTGFQKASHNYKELVAIIEAFPRDELLQIDEHALFETALSILALHERPKVKLYIQPSLTNNFLSCIIFIPRERFSDKLCAQIQELLASYFGGKIDRDYLFLNESRLARYHLILTAIPSAIEALEEGELEEKIIALTSFWDDDSHKELINKLGLEEGEKYYSLYQSAFPYSYQEVFGVSRLAYDIKTFEETIKDNQLKFELHQNKNTFIFDLKIYSPDKQLPLSSLMPILDNIGFHTVDSFTFPITRKDHLDTLWLHYFRVSAEHIDLEDFKHYKHNIENILALIWEGRIKSDKFNALVLTAKLSPREILLLKSIAKYVKQAGVVYPLNYVATIFTSHSKIVSKIIKLFHYKFSPEENDLKEFEATLQEINQLLTTVSGAAEDKMLRNCIYVIQAMLRTNYYQKDSNDEYKDYISFKVKSANVPTLPLPRPFAEISVYSTRIEGIHLRGGEVARGGLRLSDRHEDFRTEVLGLMKTQMAKNSIIVPVGSKGGFIVKRQKIGASKEQQVQEAIECYKTFLSGMLDITDNILDGKIIPPKDVVRHDNDDPYLVVAADKGTATFSDIANSISAEYNFWLGDAFASGGSQGYDHKKMGITARGGWVCVIRHFQEMGIDVFKQEFTVTGIGDMSGDVFGNFMLLSDNIKLIGAFNHMHIFVDPNPDSKKSYNERKRLFTTPGTTWADYNADLISKGGRIFERKAKELKLTPEIQEALNITEDVISPDNLIKAILTAPVDLLWNGGIGTYVKAKEEHPEHVGDKANDSVRVNGEELKCKIVGEGGNLGFTQRGRIEYALNGGRINTDAIDNSAGVDCSDHEVNIKIAFNLLMRSGKVSEQQRNTMLESMTDEVSKLVLADNRAQSLAVSIEQSQAPNLVNEHGILINLLEKEGLLDRAIEFLPSHQEIELRGANKIGLTRPEISILLSYSKISFYNKILKSKLPDDNYFDSYLLDYFPIQMKEKFKSDLVNHPLRREIISTVIINTIINRVGVSFTHITLEEAGCEPKQFAEAFVASCQIFGIDELWSEVENLPFNHNLLLQKNTMFKTMQKLMQNSILWLIKNIPKNYSIDDMVRDYSVAFNEFKKSFIEGHNTYIFELYKSELQKFLDLGIDKELATKIAEVEILAISFNIVKFAKLSGLNLAEATQIYFNIDEAIEFVWLKETVLTLSTTSYWQRTALKNLIEELDNLQVAMCISVNQQQQKFSDLDKFNNWLMSNEISIQRYHEFISQIKREHKLEELAVFAVALNRIKYLFDIKCVN
ncbi:MAG: NAD-glutamate dehydrogenase [Sphingobacteriia bacterium]|nr:NAD-glutamate dehydrogenase [Sphingobacteriia bacterium]